MDQNNSYVSMTGREVASGRKRLTLRVLRVHRGKRGSGGGADDVNDVEVERNGGLFGYVV